MDDLLTPVSTTTVKHSKKAPTLVEDLPSNRQNRIDEGILTSLDSISQALAAQPSADTVWTILKLLADGPSKDTLNLVTPGSIQAQIVDILVSRTIPDFWKLQKEQKKFKALLAKCLRNGNGLGALMSRLRPLIADARQQKPPDQTRDAATSIEDILDVLQEILIGDETSTTILNDIQSYASNLVQQRLMWKEYVSQVASGKLVALIAEAEDVLKTKNSPRKPCWLGSGNEFGSWLGRNIALLVKTNTGADGMIPAVSEIMGRSLNLGYTDRLVASMASSMINGGYFPALSGILIKLKAHEQRKYLNAMLAFLASRYLTTIVESQDDAPLPTSPTISGAASLLLCLLGGNEILKDHLVSNLTQSNTAALDDSLSLRRSAIAALAEDHDKLHDLLEKSIKLFGDSFYIKHTPILQQEALAQALTITCGYVHRSQPMFLTMMAKSSYHVSGMSNRIGASSPRARLLGMVVGTAISRIVDKPELQLKFNLEDNEGFEAKWYQRLTTVKDDIGNIDDLKQQQHQIPLLMRKKPRQPSITQAPTRSITEIQGPRVVEILDESSDEDEDLVSYPKLDSDPEDSDDDPTLVNRNKPTAPVYIRDLLSGLRDNEDYDRHQLALSTASSLIRRKANFGSEVTDHLEGLATVLAGLQDSFELPEFHEQRQQALVAVLLTKPAAMAQWFARSFFSGDYSLMQRTAMLTTLGLAARELAGLKDSSTDNLIPSSPSFPSKELPPHLHKLYASETNSNPVARITSGLTKELLSPMAAQAADTLTGPSILKVRTFSSRMEVEKRRSKPIPNALAQIVADNFFFPLTGRWWIATRSASSDSIYTSQHLLPAFLQTLALLLHASGPNTLALPQMTRELWELLLSVRGIAAQDKGVLSALLFAFLMLLETNENKERLVNEQGKELLETQEWVRMVFEHLGAGSDEDEKVRVLAAGVVVRCQEVVEKYQRRLAGAMMDY
ncbi:hypothetical protein EJ04DRAFT_484876 [Polyplosphaeria fusca]|uniref:Telomere length regulation protein conserved domain-containing protein n=1 Tax=Polyplosphaeria fusca TaxID=682080 RepID=A0A9P4R9R0_9PLEO|nr:hypothetical protein EJ04DRAFT_484876 [Polyplosphaeria fusca]